MSIITLFILVKQLHGTREVKLVTSYVFDFQFR